MYRNFRNKGNHIHTLYRTEGRSSIALFCWLCLEACRSHGLCMTSLDVASTSAQGVRHENCDHRCAGSRCGQIETKILTCLRSGLAEAIIGSKFETQFSLTSEVSLYAYAFMRLPCHPKPAEAGRGKRRADVPRVRSISGTMNLPSFNL